MNIDSLDHHIRNLTNQHNTVESKLTALLKQKSWDEFEAENLKKQKLKLKDELSLCHKKRYELMNEIQWE
jgi:hypothetical protein